MLLKNFFVKTSSEVKIKEHF